MGMREDSQNQLVQLLKTLAPNCEWKPYIPVGSGVTINTPGATASLFYGTLSIYVLHRSYHAIITGKGSVNKYRVRVDALRETTSMHEFLLHIKCALERKWAQQLARASSMRSVYLEVFGQNNTPVMLTVTHAQVEAQYEYDVASGIKKRVAPKSSRWEDI